MSKLKRSTVPSVSRQKFPIHQTVTLAAVGKLGRPHLERIVDRYLRGERYRCSPEYRLGMIDLLCQRAFKTGIVTRFKRGSAQSDAHWAGIEHGHTVWEEMTRKGGL
jgi:hypothetical protein